MRTFLILLALLASPVLASQTVWKWVDASGVTHYSDTPVEGAVKVELNTGTTNSWDSTAPRGPDATDSSDKPKPTNYQVEIWKPANEETFQNPTDPIDVKVRIEPDLQSRDSISLYLDGRLMPGTAPRQLEFTLSNLERGTHSVVAVIDDGRGKQLTQSQAVQFFVRQPSVLDPLHRQPTAPPPPKPKK